MLLSCKKASQIISQSLDKKLTAKERFSLNLHLVICKYCKRFSQQMQSIRVALKQSTSAIESDDSINMSSETKKRLLQSIESS